MVRQGFWVRVLGVCGVASAFACVTSAALAQPAPTDPQPAPIDPQPAPAEPAPAPAAAPAPAPSAAPAPGAAPGAAPAAQSSSYSAMAAQTGPAPATGGGSLEARLEDKAFIPVLSLGFITNGSGEAEQECDASGGITCPATGGSSDYDDKSSFVIGADFLFRVVPKFRLGLGLQWIPTPTVEFDGSTEDFESGHQFDATFVGEGVFPVADTVGIYVRGQVGAAVLVAGNDHEDLIDNLKDICTANNGPGVSCDVSEGPFVGPTFGLGVGVLVLLGNSVGLRAGIVGQYYSLPLTKTKVSGGGVSLETTSKMSGNRGMLMVGIEI